MAFQVSPGVEVKEIDLTNVIPAVSTSIGAFAGHFSWGPVGEVKLVSSEKELINEYGTPVDTTTGGQYDNYTSFLQAASFLKYSNTLRISRACSGTATNAAGSRYEAATTVTLVNKEDDFAGASFGAKPGVVQARYPGTAGNSLKLQIATGLLNSGNFTDANLNDMVNASAGTSAWASSNVTGSTSDEVHIAVIDEDGLFSGVKGTVLEVFEGLSLYSDALKDGGSNYYKTVVNRDSAYVYINEAALVSSSFNSSAVGGVTYAVPGNAGTSGKLFNAAGLKGSSQIATISTVSLANRDDPNDIAVGTYTVSTEDSGVTTSGSGGSATFTVVISEDGSAGLAAAVSVVNGGFGFAVGNTITIPEALIGASSDANSPDEDLTITVATLNTANAGLFNYSLVNGVDGTSAPVAGDIVTALGQFANPEEIDINLLFAEGVNGNTAIHNEVIRIAGTARKDCVGFVSPDTTATQASDVTGDLNYNSSYIVQDSSAVYVYNKYNDSYRYIPANGHIAGLCARTDDTNDPWFSPAGYNRGNLLGVTKLKWNPAKADRDTLYKAGINPIISEPGQGILLFGDKTAQSKPSAFDRINVRRLFVVLEKAISTASKFQLFELNDEFTRAMFRNMTEPFLRDVKGRRGITDFLVVCDETNNTGAVIDTNRFVADIYIKPARSINFITLNFVATRTGVEFSEIVGTGN
jgi:phage tail sheath protein FI